MKLIDSFCLLYEWDSYTAVLEISVSVTKFSLDVIVFVNSTYTEDFTV